MVGQGLFILTKIHAALTSPFLEPTGLVRRRGYYILFLLMNQADGLPRTGAYTKTATNAPLLDNVVRVLSFFDGVHLTTFVCTEPADRASIRIYLSVIVGVDHTRGRDA